ncbi:MAG: MarR family transcriptional regulator [Asgard group archaeon]|nr:MarR family transcriptional regulator [Asgard group archaeon]
MIKSSLSKTLFSILVYTSLISTLLIINYTNSVIIHEKIIGDNNTSLSLKQNMNELTIINDQILYTNSLNDIASAKVTCYLHLKTTQVQLDIDFVGSDSESIGEINSKYYTSFEEISVYGQIRGVQVIESNTIELEYFLEVVDNSTKIQFALSTDIPVGFVRNVKITFIQDTKDFLTHYNYELGVNWQRRIGNQNVIVICDKGISLMNCLPPPHSISTISNKLVLSWLEVNRYSFFADINYTSLVILDDLKISPDTWNIGRTSKDNEPLVNVFSITNFENQKLDGTIIKPDWVETNFTDWELNIGETIYLEIIIDRSISRNCDCIISLQCSLASFPVDIEISGKVANLSTGSIVTISLLTLILVIFATTTIVYFYKRNYFGNEKLTQSDLIIEEEIYYKIDFDKWKEILTVKEFVIFQIITNEIELTQAEIVRQTSLSKSTVSRAVGRLIAKGLVRKEKYGMSNIISLNKEFFLSNHY